MYKIAIIGAGQLGSRHLQGLKLAKLPMQIYIVDSSEQSLLVAKNRYEEIPENKYVQGIYYSVSLEELPLALDLVIVATGSCPRLDILKNLFSKKIVKNLVLEKFLFQDLGEYCIASELLQEHNVQFRTWVNCTRRMFSGYKKLQAELRNTSSFKFTASGHDWGLACNGIHMIDLFAFLKESNDIHSIDVSELEKKVYPSKRNGYVEFMGVIRSSVNNEATMVIECLQGQPNALTITIDADGRQYVIDENTGEITKNGKLWDNVDIKYQSALTGCLAEQILTENRSDLPTFNQSASLHYKFLEALVPFYNNLSGKQGDSCPIT